jgi:hypothetical protein
MNIGCDGAGEGDEFGPDSMWAYIHQNPADDAVTDEEWAEIFRQFENPEDDPADWWKNA